MLNIIELEKRNVSCVSIYHLHFVVHIDSVICSCISDGLTWSTEPFDYELLRHGKGYSSQYAEYIQKLSFELNCLLESGNLKFQNGFEIKYYLDISFCYLSISLSPNPTPKHDVAMVGLIGLDVSWSQWTHR